MYAQLSSYRLIEGVKECRLELPLNREVRVLTVVRGVMTNGSKVELLIVLSERLLWRKKHQYTTTKKLVFLDRQG